MGKSINEWENILSEVEDTSKLKKIKEGLEALYSIPAFEDGWGDTGIFIVGILARNVIEERERTAPAPAIVNEPAPARPDDSCTHYSGSGVGVDLPVATQPTFLSLLQSGVELDCDLIIGDCDMLASFVWNSDSYISEYGIKKFTPIMYATYERLANGNIRINCDNVALGEEFTASAAGYVGLTEYNKLFTKLHGA